MLIFDGPAAVFSNTQNLTATRGTSIISHFAEEKKSRGDESWTRLTLSRASHQSPRLLAGPAATHIAAVLWARWSAYVTAAPGELICSCY